MTSQTQYTADMHDAEGEVIETIQIGAPSLVAALNHLVRVVTDHERATDMTGFSLIQVEAPEQEGEPTVGF